MAPEIHDRLRRAYALFNTDGSLDWDLIDPAIEHDQTEGLFLDGVFYGAEGIQAALDEIMTDWDGLQFELEEMIDLGDRLLVTLRMRARVRESRAELDAQVAHVWEFRDGRAVRWCVYSDRAAAMRALESSGALGSAS